MLDALEKGEEKPLPDSPPTTNKSDRAILDPDEIIEKLF